MHFIHELLIDHMSPDVLISYLSAEAVDDDGGTVSAADGEVGEEPPHLVALVLVERLLQRVGVGAVGELWVSAVGSRKSLSHFHSLPALLGSMVVSLGFTPLHYF